VRLDKCFGNFLADNKGLDHPLGFVQSCLIMFSGTALLIFALKVHKTKLEQNRSGCSIIRYLDPMSRSWQVTQTSVQSVFNLQITNPSDHMRFNVFLLA